MKQLKEPTVSVLNCGDGAFTRMADLEAVEFATLRWVDWFNHRRLLGPIGFVPPAEHEANYDQQASVA